MPEQLSFKWGPNKTTVRAGTAVKEHMSFEVSKRIALSSCAFRGHAMKPLRLTQRTPGQRRVAAKCRNCPAWVNVIEHPAPNEVNCAGPALAMTCPTDKKWC